MRRAATLLLALALGSPLATSAQELGRLFFTPEQRDALDARRKARLPDKPAAVLAPSPTTRIDGSVQRSSGRSTLFVDGAAVPDGTQPDGLRIRRSGDASRVTVVVGEENRRIDMRVGETLDRASGEVKGVLGDGEVQIRRHGAAPR